MPNSSIFEISVMSRTPLSGDEPPILLPPVDREEIMSLLARHSRGKNNERDLVISSTCSSSSSDYLRFDTKITDSARAEVEEERIHQTHVLQVKQSLRQTIRSDPPISIQRVCREGKEGRKTIRIFFARSQNQKALWIQSKKVFCFILKGNSPILPLPLSLHLLSRCSCSEGRGREAKGHE